MQIWEKTEYLLQVEPQRRDENSNSQDQFPIEGIQNTTVG